RGEPECAARDGGGRHTRLLERLRGWDVDAGAVEQRAGGDGGGEPDSAVFAGAGRVGYLLGERSVGQRLRGAAVRERDEGREVMFKLGPAWREADKVSHAGAGRPVCAARATRCARNRDNVLLPCARPRSLVYRRSKESPRRPERHRIVPPRRGCS